MRVGRYNANTTMVWMYILI